MKRIHCTCNCINNANSEMRVVPVVWALAEALAPCPPDPLPVPVKPDGN